MLDEGMTALCRLGLAVAVGLLALAPAPARATETLVELNDIRADEIISVGFELPRAAEIQIEAVGLSADGKHLAAYAWLLDNKTRQPVWTMEISRRDRKNWRGDRVTVDEKLRLEPGRYELYLAAIGGWKNIYFDDGDFRNLGDVLRGLSDVLGGKNKGNGDFDRELRHCYVSVLSDELTNREVKLFEVTGEIPGALVQFRELGDDEFIKQGFELAESARLRVYALVEIPSKTAVDRAWIVDAESHETVWETTRRNTAFAGGGEKNRVADDEIDLDAGRYILYYASDDSHSWEYFNTRPPYDPMNWGVSLVSDGSPRKGSFTLFEPAGRGDAIVDLTRARDADYLEQAFEVTRETQVHVYAVGEYSDWGDEFVDYGGIQNAGSGELVWEMTGRNTFHAGGAEKNRAFEGAVTLPPGKYVAFYITDDSHSYRDWNASAPYEPDAWGLALYPGSDYRDGDVRKISNDDLAGDGDVLARMVRVRDDEHRRATFTLDRSTRIRIYALGEGDDGHMYDYGWIEDRESRRPVWEMTYRKTRHAGGAKKNRVFDDEIMLDAGTYEVHFESDGSHSFGDWNATRPRNPMQWGITVSVAPSGGS